MYYRNVAEMAKDLHISENYIYQIISMRTDKVPSISLLEFICEKWNIDITEFFKNPNFSYKDDRKHISV